MAIRLQWLYNSFPALPLEQLMPHRKRISAGLLLTKVVWQDFKAIFAAS